ncbi:MAG: cytochrome c-type biogenesis protein CcmH [Chloroflexi bacterium]|nr:cytochrome c-type biogenesis protein CcmH [Chloroflexota bacterium]
MRPRVAIALGTAALAVSIAVTALPRAEPQEDRVERISTELRCPVCQGLSVADSPSDMAREMRGLVRQRVAEGRTDDEIRAEFRQAYGDWILLSPPLLDARGAVWAIPPLAVIAGGVLVARRLRREAAAPVMVTPAQHAAIERRVLEEALAE